MQKHWLAIANYSITDLTFPVKKKVKIIHSTTFGSFWSARQESNLQSPESESGALSGYATGGFIRIIIS